MRRGRERVYMSGEVSEEGRRDGACEWGGE